MDAGAILRMIGSLGLVLGLLAGALWIVRRFNLRLPGGGIVRSDRVEIVERVSLDPKRCVALLRRDGREHLILIAPEGHVVIESGIRPDAADRKAQQERQAEAEARRLAQEAALAAARDQFADLVQRAAQRFRPQEPAPGLATAAARQGVRKGKTRRPAPARTRAASRAA